MGGGRFKDTTCTVGMNLKKFRLLQITKKDTVANSNVDCLVNFLSASTAGPPERQLKHSTIAVLNRAQVCYATSDTERELVADYVMLSCRSSYHFKPG